MRDDDDDEVDDRTGPPIFPGIVKVAGIIWIGVGAIAMIGVSLGMQGGNQAGGNQPPPGWACGICFGLLIGIAFVACGYQTVTRKASDTLGNSIGSLLLGLIVTLWGIGMMAVGAGNMAGASGIVQGVVAAMEGSTLILAGMLGLVGRSAYKDWKMATAPKRRRRPRRRRMEEDDEDEDDRDSRRRRRRRQEEEEDEDDRELR